MIDDLKPALSILAALGPSPARMERPFSFILVI